MSKCINFTKTTSLTETQKEKWKPCLVLDLMSSVKSTAENSNSSDNDIFTVRPLPWRTDKVTSFFVQLDE